jgi:general L-amino acid transport system permease protein
MYRGAALALVTGLILFILVPGAANLTWSSDGLGRYLGQEVYPLLVILRDSVFILIGCLFAGYIVGRVLRRINGWLARRLVTVLWLLAIPFTFILVRGLGADTPLVPFVSTNEWGGLLLTFMLAFVAIVACFPLGVALAMGRAAGGPTQASLELPRRWWLNPARWQQVLVRWWRGLGYYPLIKLFCIVYIEFLRGVPLVTVFFTANLIVPLALGDTSIDAVVRAMVALTLFEAAYIAEIVRGGLQSVPPGQAEAAKALGMSPVKVMVYITLPQALRTVIPALVGQFITMFKDTSLVAIVGLLDLMGTANGIAAQPEFTERKREVFVFAAIVYFVFSYSMSYAARKLEKRGSGSVRRM